MQSTKTKFIVSEITWDTDGEQVDLLTVCRVIINNNNLKRRNYESICKHPQRRSP
jgi:hypothetical protein